MPKGDLLYLGHMLDVAAQAISKLEGKEREDYEEDENLRLAVTHLVQMIGEAARRVSPEIQQRYPQIPWSDIIGMRHKIVHDYLEVDSDVVWEVVKTDLPDLVAHLELIVPSETPE